MLVVLGLIDVVMIANLLIMVIIGGYETFANVLKVKLAMAIIGISSIHLLKTFIGVGAITERGAVENGEEYTSTGVMWQVTIHCVFILSALALAWIDRMSYHRGHPGETHDGVPVPVVGAEQLAPAPARSAASDHEQVPARS